MEASSRKVQPVSFNLTDRFEKELYDYAVSNGAFSKYIKRLIQRDKEGGVQAVVKAPSQAKRAVVDSFL
ncbi:hypothetical protein DOE78_18740 [Bacillus sp. Y1]|nr:hypothetical protein [Bacillus sp. Y1]AYA77321.1 hypothetical protein DOE78_18740 [Bacillus sp. Y1]